MSARRISGVPLAHQKRNGLLELREIDPPVISACKETYETDYVLNKRVAAHE
jgi:hypothetical protein